MQRANSRISVLVRTTLRLYTRILSTCLGVSSMRHVTDYEPDDKSSRLLYGYCEMFYFISAETMSENTQRVSEAASMVVKTTESWNCLLPFIYL
jgi:hypothetical protein